ncbi:LOW QUALITY PROTEIN: hypothetical protein M8C21_008387, partial [Ambrosia artemisiifolia]
FAPLLNMFPGQMPPELVLQPKLAKAPALGSDVLGKEIVEHGNVRCNITLLKFMLQLPKAKRVHNASTTAIYGTKLTSAQPSLAGSTASMQPLGNEVQGLLHPSLSLLPRWDLDRIRTPKVNLSILMVNINKQKKKDAFQLLKPYKNHHCDPRTSIDKTKLLRPKKMTFMMQMMNGNQLKAKPPDPGVNDASVVMPTISMMDSQPSEAIIQGFNNVVDTEMLLNNELKDNLSEPFVRVLVSNKGNKPVFAMVPNLMPSEDFIYTLEIEAKCLTIECEGFKTKIPVFSEDINKEFHKEFSYVRETVSFFEKDNLIVKVMRDALKEYCIREYGGYLDLSLLKANYDFTDCLSSHTLTIMLKRKILYTEKVLYDIQNCFIDETPDCILSGAGKKAKPYVEIVPELVVTPMGKRIINIINKRKKGDKGVKGKFEEFLRQGFKLGKSSEVPDYRPDPCFSYETIIIDQDSVTEMDNDGVDSGKEKGVPDIKVVEDVKAGDKVVKKIYNRKSMKELRMDMVRRKEKLQAMCKPKPIKNKNLDPNHNPLVKTVLGSIPTVDNIVFDAKKDAEGKSVSNIEKIMEVKKAENEKKQQEALERQKLLNKKGKGTENLVNKKGNSGEDVNSKVSYAKVVTGKGEFA